ncbi:iron ABC transporter permease, partial [Vibrio parahaemolyticus]|nr:iron ABC transporter permease [Vibrio parahaemolyticus]
MRSHYSNMRVSIILVCILSIAFIFTSSGWDFDYVIPKRLIKLGAIVIGGSCVAISAVIFQALAGN